MFGFTSYLSYSTLFDACLLVEVLFELVFGSPTLRFCIGMESVGVLSQEFKSQNLLTILEVCKDPAEISLRRCICRERDRHRVSMKI